MALHTHDAPHAPIDAALLPPQTDVERQMDDDMAAPALTTRALHILEPRAPYSTQSPDANTSSTETARQPVTRRPFVMADHLLYEIVNDLGGSTTLVLMMFERETIGRQRTSVRLSINDIAAHTQLSKPTVRTALADLETANIVTSDAEQRGPTQVRTYTRQEPELWNIHSLLEARRSPTSQKFLPVANTGQKTFQDAPQTRQKNILVDDKTSQKNLPVEAQTSQKICPPINKEIEKKEKKEKEYSVAANAAGATRKATPKPNEKSNAPKQRELSPDHQYRVNLLAVITAANDGIKTAPHDLEWKAAGQCYAWPTGPIPVETVADCYSITRQLPKYDVDDLKLNDLVNGRRHLNAYLRSGRDAYLKGIERSRKAANGTLHDDPAYTHPRARAAPPPAEPRRLRSADSVRPVGWG